MTTDESNLPANIYLVSYPDQQSAAYLQSLIQSWDPHAHILIVHSLTDLFAQIETIPDRAITLTELIWDGQDASDVLQSLSISYPRVSQLIVTNADTASILPAYFPIPCVQGMDNTHAILSHASNLTEDLRGSKIGPYLVQDFAGQNNLGRTYGAHQPLIKRDVHLTVLPMYATEQELRDFRNISAARARNIHPQIFAIYEESVAEGRAYVAQEPVNSPSLLQLSLQDVTFDSRVIAKLLAGAATVLGHLHTNNIPYQPIRSSHITLSQEGVIKLLNTALPAGSVMPEMTDELAELATIIREFCPREEPLDLRLTNLLQNMTTEGISFITVAQIAGQVDLDLAPVKYVAERKESIQAQQAVKKARKAYWIYMSLIATAISALLIFILLNLVASFIVLPGTDFKKQVRIPAGKAFAGDQMIDVNEFYIDEYEVTIGAYEKFLKAVKDEPVSKYLPPELAKGKSSFEPSDWEGMQKALKPHFPKRSYLGTPITRDTPIFNVDYADAWAYATWRGKRLPTELEWQRAAAGDKNLTYPWGEKKELAYTNTGADCVKPKPDGIEPGSIDGFAGLAAVDQLPKDRSPYGVYDMAGNVSEWTVPCQGFRKIPLPANDRPIRGGNFQFGKLVPNQYYGLHMPKDSEKPGIGFRCASDKPIE